MKNHNNDNKPQIKFKYLIKELKKNPELLNSYESDIFHDSIFLNEKNPDRFIWILRELGTFIFDLKDITDSASTIESQNPNTKYFYYNRYDSVEWNQLNQCQMVQLIKCNSIKGESK